MEFDFFSEWELVCTAKVGSQLMKKIVNFQSIDNMDLVESRFPNGHPDEGCEVERYILENNRYFFAEELSTILFDECHKVSKERSQVNSATKRESSEFKNNPQTLVELLSLVLNKNITHFSLG